MACVPHGEMLFCRAFVFSPIVRSLALGNNSFCYILSAYLPFFCKRQIQSCHCEFVNQDHTADQSSEYDVECNNTNCAGDAKATGEAGIKLGKLLADDEGEVS